MTTDVVELEIERIAVGGYGLARTSSGVVFVRGALPGERVTARPRPRDGVLKAHAISILEPHPQRVDLGLPPGADLPLIYEAQLPIKQSLVEEALRRVASLDVALQPIAPSPHTLGYRTAAQYAVAATGLGARATDSNKIVPLEGDPLVVEPINAVLRALHDRTLHGVVEVAFRASVHEDAVVIGLLGDAHNRRAAERHVSVLASHARGVVWSEVDARGRFRGRTTVLHGTDRLLEDYGIVATVTVQSFAQVNPAAAARLYREASIISGVAPRALDLYAGGGVLGLHLAPLFDEVVAVDISNDAITRGRADARRLGVRNMTFHRGDARALARFLPADLVAVDPPRAGLSEDVAQLLAHHRPPRILYVSCDPTTWARDIARLVAGGYRLTFARPYDFYPFTHHVEVLSLLET